MHVGAYGWAVDIEPPIVAAIVGGSPTPDPESAGFIHAPSLAQARIAAVLYGGYRSRSEGDDEGCSRSICRANGFVALAECSTESAADRRWVCETPAGGVHLTHRIAVLLPVAGATESWFGDDKRPRRRCRLCLFRCPRGSWGPCGGRILYPR